MLKRKPRTAQRTKKQLLDEVRVPAVMGDEEESAEPLMKVQQGRGGQFWRRAPIWTRRQQKWAQTSAGGATGSGCSRGAEGGEPERLMLVPPNPSVFYWPQIEAAALWVEPPAPGGWRSSCCRGWQGWEVVGRGQGLLRFKTH